MYWGVFFLPLFSWLHMIPGALGPSVKGVCGTELRSLSLQGGKEEVEGECTGPFLDTQKWHISLDSFTFRILPLPLL